MIAKYPLANTTHYANKSRLLIKATLRRGGVSMLRYASFWLDILNGLLKKGV
jgi:hypothetical protein